MEAIRRAISMPTLCSSDTVIPHSCARRGSKGKRRKKRRNSRTKLKREDNESMSSKEAEALGGAGFDDHRKKDDKEIEGKMETTEAPLPGPTQKPASMSFVKLRILTWSRLIDSRGGSSNKIHPMLNEDGPGPPRNYGSSVDLAPTLMSIYDNYASTDVCQVDDECNHNTSPDKSPTTITSTSDPAHLSGGLSYGKDDIDNLAVIGNASGDVITPHVISHEKRIFPCHSTSRSVAMETDLKDCCENDGPPAALSSTIASLTSHHQNDAAKKRPLSVSSTSSATSTSSLPRQQRKKVAGNNNPTSSLAQNGPTTMVVSSIPCSVTSMLPPTLPPTSDMIMDTLTDEEGEEDYTKCRTRSDVTVSRSTSGSQADYDTSQLTADSRSGAQMSYIDKVVAEILETERTYVHDLNEIIKGYLYEFRGNSPHEMDKAEVDALFGNIEQICNFNKLFLTQLEGCQQDAVRLAQCFVDNNEGFVIYSDYCTNYPGALEVLKNVMEDEEKGEVFKRLQFALGHTLPLGAYLLKPVQRILKYHLLLQNLLPHMKPESGEKQVVEQALSSMTSMAQHINEMKRQHEHALRLQELQALICEWDDRPDFHTYGDLVKEETFKMHGAKGDRHLILFERGLLIAKRKEDSGLLLKDCIKCSNLMLVERVPKEPLSFHVIPFDNPRGQYTFQARCLDQKREWCQELKRLILESYTADKAIPKNIIELVMQLTSKEEEGVAESGSNASTQVKKPCPKPQYLEKKKRRKSVTSVLSDLSSIKSHVTKKVLTRRSEGSPRLSPRVQRRRSDSAVPRETMRRLIEKQKKRELLCEDDCSDTDSAGRTQYGSLESIHTSDASSTHAPHRLSVPGDTGATASSDIGEESGLDSVENTPTSAPLYLKWPPPGPEDSGYSPKSPVRRRESFRIATTLNPMETRHGVHRPTSANPQSVKDKKMRYLLRSRRRVSESDLNMMTNSLAEDETDRDDNYIQIPPTYRLANGNEGDDECDNDDPIYFNVNKPVSLVEDDDGDYVELPIYYKQPYSGGDSNNNPRHQRLSLISNDHIRGSESNPRSRAPVASGHLISKGLRATARSSGRESVGEGQAHRRVSLSTPRQSERSVSPCNGRVERTYRNPQVMKSRERKYNERSGCESVGVYDNMPSSASREMASRISNRTHSRQRWSTPQHIIEMTPPPVDTYSRNSSVSDVFINEPVNSPLPRTVIKNNPWVPRSGRPATRKPQPRQRSNSLSSLSDFVDEPYPLQADMLVFTNRNAFVTTHDPQSIRHDVETDRAIARFATPPREFGPVDVIQVIKESKEHGRIVTRYATPPRTVQGSSSVIISNGNDQVYTGPPDGESRPGVPARRTLPADMRYSGLGLWSGFEDYISRAHVEGTGSVPKFPVTGGTGQDYYGQCSSPGAVSSSHSSSIHSPSLSSPSSVTSNDSLVDTIKQKVFNLTSRFTSHLPRSTESSPRRAPRSNSFGALEDLRVDQSPDTRESSQKKEKRGRFVSSLARVYSDRQKKNSPPLTDEPKDTSLERSPSEVSKQLANLLKESKPGSNVIGERMAVKPLVLGTYTLPRHRYRKNKKGAKEKSENEEGCEGEEEVEDGENEPVVRRQKADQERADSSCYDSGVKDMALDNGEQSLEATLAAFNQAFSGLDTTEFAQHDDDSMCYYEEKFAEDLESNFGSDIFRDSAVYSDEGSPGTEPEPTSPNVSIKETVKLIEERSKLKALPRTEIREEEKAKGIKNILKSLEAANSAGVSGNGKGEGEQEPASASDKATLKTVRDRTRELIECATLARIRQDACQVVEDLPSVGEQEEEDASTPLRRGRSRSRRWRQPIPNA